MYLNFYSNIGGYTLPSLGTIGATIDTFNFENNENLESVATLAFDRKMHDCALIPKGKDGNPTVAICKLLRSKMFKYALFQKDVASLIILPRHCSSIYKHTYRLDLSIEVDFDLPPDILLKLQAISHNAN